MIKQYSKGSNVFDYTDILENYSISSQGALVSYTGRFATENKIDVSAADIVELSYGGSDNIRAIYASFDGTTLVNRETGLRTPTAIDVTGCDGLLLAFYASGGANITPEDVPNIELRSTWTELQYKKYVSGEWTAANPKEYSGGEWQ